jgi:hypothetical protein
LIDFKKELYKFKPAQTLEELNNGVASGDITDMNDFLRYITTEQINVSKQTEKRSRKPRGTSQKRDDDY